MTFAGWQLGALLSLGGAAGAAVVVLYILKLRRRAVPVPFSLIWQRILGERETTALFSKLKRILSLLLQLLLLGLLVLALGDPHWRASRASGRNIVVLVDTSASMQATDVRPSRLAAAKQQLTQIVRGLGGADRMLIASMSAAVTPLSTMTEDAATLEDSISRITATDTRADLRRGLAFAEDSLRGLGRPTVILVSDGAFGDLAALGRLPSLGPIELQYVPVGKSAHNVGITAFSVRRYPLDASRYEVMVELLNTTKEPVDVELKLRGDGEIVDLSELSLQPEQRLSRFYENQGGASRTLEAEIRLLGGRPDELSADNHAYALMPERKRARVLVVTRGNTYLEAALLLDEYLDVTTVAPAEFDARAARDVVIFDNAVPPGAANMTGAALYLNPPKDSSPVPLGKSLDMFGFDSWQRKSPILRWMAMGDIQVLDGHAFKPGPGDHVLGSSESGPLLVSGERGSQRFVALSFDPKRSDFVLRVAWPLFLLNTIRHFVEQDSGYVSSLRTGEVWSVNVGGKAESATLVDPHKKVRVIPVRDGRATHFGELAGYYTLRISGTDAAAPLLLAANLASPEESAIAPRPQLALGGGSARPLGRFSAGVRRELWLYLVLGAVLLSIIEWITYHRRVTV
ncbi:MAG: VWA domain-containing protein [Polyangiaceae bacterium]|nr:VWA domain-containing protein [Polyangiaceae bacterium]